MSIAGWRRCAGRILIALVVGLQALAACADQALDDYNLAVQLYRQSRWQLATEGFRKFLQDFPEHEKASLARLYLGLTLVNQSDFTGAREVLRKFVKETPQNPNLPQAKYRVAECSYLLNDLTAARGELQTYLKDYPDDPLGERAWAYLGDVHLRLNDPRAAIAAFAEAVKRYPEGALVDDAQFGWAKALDAAKQDAEALAKYRTLASGSGPRAAEALFQIGSREFDAGQFAEAAKTYQTLTDRFPESALVPDAHLNAGFALFRGQDYAAASQAFQLVTKDKSRAVQAGYWQALSEKSLGNYQAAIDLLTQLQPQAAKDPLGEAIAFQKGMCQRLAGQSDAAQASLLAVVEGYPKGDLADDALHFATELALEAGQLPAARERLDRFTKEFPQSGLRLYQQLLAGRYELALAGQKAAENQNADVVQAHYTAALKEFEQVLQASTLPRTRFQAAFYTGLTRQLQGNHPQALEALQPLAAEVEKGTATAEFADVLVLQADSLLQTGKFEEAAQVSAKYLAQYSAGRQRPRARSIEAIAQAQRKFLPESQQALAQLEAEFPQSPFAVSTALRLAELADERADWPAAAVLYAKLPALGKGTEYEVVGLRGWAWAEYQQRKFAEAARLYGDLVTRFPEHALAAEARYYQAESLREQGAAAEAAQAFAAAFEKLAPATPAGEGAESQLPLVYAYRSGLQGARLEGELKNVAAADALYAALLDKFPRPQQLDKVLDEWALLNYSAERYAQADEIFRRLIRDVPDSDLADNALLSLAESDLIANRLEAARESFEKLRISEKSDDVVRERAHYQLIVLALEQQRWPDVLKLAAEFQADYPDSPSFSYARYAAAEATLADAKTPTERLEPLLAELAQMTQMLPTGPPAWAPRLWVLAAEAQFRLKRYDDILATVGDLKKQLPDSPLTYQVEEVLGRALKQQAKFPEARTALERVINDERAFRTETAAKSQFLIAETWFLQEKWKDAFLAYQKVYASYAYPEWQSAALLQAGKCDEQLGNLPDAIATYDRLIAEFPNSTHIEEARRRLMQAKLKSGSSR